MECEIIRPLFMRSFSPGGKIVAAYGVVWMSGEENDVTVQSVRLLQPVEKLSSWYKMAFLLGVDIRKPVRGMLK